MGNASFAIHVNADLVEVTEFRTNARGETVVVGWFTSEDGGDWMDEFILADMLVMV